MSRATRTGGRLARASACFRRACSSADRVCGGARRGARRRRTGRGRRARPARQSGGAAGTRGTVERELEEATRAAGRAALVPATGAIAHRATVQ